MFYVVFWLVPIVCLYPMILRLKTITEHFDPGLRVTDNVQWTARTSVAGRLQNHLIGARMEYHFEHHVLPTIPYPGPAGPAPAAGSQRGLFERDRSVLSGGYVRFLARGAARQGWDGGLSRRRHPTVVGGSISRTRP